MYYAMYYVWIGAMKPLVPSPSRIWYVGYASQMNCKTNVSVWFDGASRNNGSPDNPMSAGFGVCAVHLSDRVIFGGYGYLGSVSNNRAEFTAFAAACQWVAESGVQSATVLGDSELVVEAFHGRRTLYSPALRHLMAVAKAWLAQAGTVCVEHAPRRFNGRADALANSAVDSQSSVMTLRDSLDWVIPSVCPPGWGYFESDDPALPPRLAGTRSITKALAEVEVPSAADLLLPDSKNFVAGNLHRFAPMWARICSRTAVGEQVAKWAKDGVDVYDFSSPSRGNLTGEDTDPLSLRGPSSGTMSSPLHMSLLSLPRYSESSGLVRSANGAKLGKGSHPA